MYSHYLFVGSCMDNRRRSYISISSGSQRFNLLSKLHRPVLFSSKILSWILWIDANTKLVCVYDLFLQTSVDSISFLLSGLAFWKFCLPMKEVFLDKLLKMIIWDSCNLNQEFRICCLVLHTWPTRANKQILIK